MQAGGVNTEIIGSEFDDDLLNLSCSIAGSTVHVRHGQFIIVYAHNESTCIYVPQAL